jgi:heme-degrading monooxygenase HmoA
MMEKILIDLFKVSTEARNEFVETSNRAQSIVKALPGFVEGYLFEESSGESSYRFITIAVWESEAAYEQARAAVPIEYQKHGFNPQEILKRLDIDVTRAVYDRTPY